MSLTVLKSRKRRIHNGYEVAGIASFTTTSATGELPIELGHLDSISLVPLAAQSAEAVVGIAAPSVSATAVFHAIAPVGGVVQSVKYVAKEGQATNASVGWDWHMVNTGDDGSGTAKVVDRANAGGGNTNLTGVGGGSALTAKVAKSLTVTSTTADKTVAAGDVLELTMTKNSTATTQTEGYFLITIGSAEKLYVDEAAQVTADGVLVRPASGALTIGRTGLSLPSGSKFAFRYTGY